MTPGGSLDEEDAMANVSGDDPLDELTRTAEAAEQLASDPDAFRKAFDAYRAEDAAAFEGVLDAIGVSDRCRLVCGFFCEKHCGGICFSFCPDPPREPVDVEEMIAFAHALSELVKQPDVVERLLDVHAAGDAKAWTSTLKKHDLDRFCHQLCRFFCSVRCRRVCRKLCPPRPLITRVGDIPISQIDLQGFASGPSVGPGHTPAPNPSGGIGDHPFGDFAELRGIFNLASATQYLVEVSSTGPGGPYTPFTGSTSGYDTIPVFPWLTPCSRSTSSGVDPGWFDVPQICDSDGGPNAIGEKVLVHWPTPSADGLHHVRLRVRDGAITRVSAPQPVMVDNSGPFPLPRPTITLQLQKDDGTVDDLKCGKVKRGEGLIRVTVHAFDPNLSSVSVTARGNSNLAVPVNGVPLPLWPGGSVVPLSKTYGGNQAEQGYPVPTSFVWDPWSDPLIVPCCYLVYIEINDRTIRNDSYAGGHYNAGWEAIEIGI
jgi:hypothetical protein